MKRVFTKMNTIRISIFFLAIVICSAVAFTIVSAAGEQGGKICFSGTCFSLWPENAVTVIDMNDRDEDWIFNYEDKCLDVPDTTRGNDDPQTLDLRMGHEGCPDKDGDTVFDNKDLCTTSSGPSPNGCPLINASAISFTFDDGSTSITVSEGETVPVRWNITRPSAVSDTDFAGYTVSIRSSSDSRLEGLLSRKPLQGDANLGIYATTVLTLTINGPGGMSVSKEITATVRRVDGKWSEPACPVQCGIGRVTRACNNPPPSGGGDGCPKEGGGIATANESETIDCSAKYFDRKEQKEKPLPCEKREGSAGCSDVETNCPGGLNVSCSGRNNTFKCNARTGNGCGFMWLKKEGKEIWCEAPAKKDGALSNWNSCPPDPCQGGSKTRSCQSEAQWGGLTCDELAGGDGYSQVCPIASECTGAVTDSTIDLFVFPHIVTSSNSRSLVYVSFSGFITTVGGYAQSVRIVGDFGDTLDLIQVGERRDKKWRLPLEKVSYERGKYQLKECETISKDGNPLSLRRKYSLINGKELIDQEFHLEVIQGGNVVFTKPIGRVFFNDWRSDKYVLSYGAAGYNGEWQKIFCYVGTRSEAPSRKFDQGSSYRDEMTAQPKLER
ncbi:MAG: hypothetical protein AAB400_05460 [Patescibacteria group bacterium]